MERGIETYNRQPSVGEGLVAGLATLLLGAALGASAALLLAPRAGQDLRSRIVGVTGTWKEHAAEALAHSRESVVSAVEQAQGAPPPSTNAAPDKGFVKPA